MIEAIKLLVIAGDEDKLSALRTQLRDVLPQVTVLTATDGAAGIRLATAENADVILLDIAMPGMDGPEVCRRLKAVDLMRDVPVVFLTEPTTDTDDKVRALEAGAEGFLTIPVETAGLIAQIQSMAKIAAANRLRRTEGERLETLFAERTREISESEAKYRAVFAQSTDAIYLHDLDGRILDVNEMACAQSGYSREELLALTVFDGHAFGSDVNLSEAQARETWREWEPGHRFTFEAEHRRKNGTVYPVEVSTGIVRYGATDHLLAVVKDITDRKSAERQERDGQVRLQSLMRILQHQSDTVQDFLDYALDEAIKLTHSKIGYIDLYDEEKQEFSFSTWSRGVMDACAILEPQTVHHLDRTGLWGAAVRERTAILINDFSAPHPLKKGWPEGHASLERYLTVPVVQGGRIVAVVGVANKETDYDHTDVLQLELLMESIWKEVERKMGELALRSEKEWSQSIIDNAPNIVVGLREDSEIAVFNKFAERLTGYKAEEVIGKKWISMFVPEELRGTVLRVWDEIVDTKAIDHGFENEIVTRSGERRLIQWSNTLIPEDGGFGMILSLGTDITQRRRDEEALREANRQLETNRSAMLNILEDLQAENEARRRNEAELQRVIMAIEQAGEMVLVADPDGAITYANPAFEAVSGYSREEVLGRNPRLLKSGKQDGAFYDDLWKTITGGRVWQGRMVNKRKDGTFYVEDATISPVMDEFGRIVSFVAVNRDVTEHLLLTEEKASLQEQLRQAQTLESIGRLAGGVAHDFNNMLGIILGYGEIVLDRLHERDPLRREVQEMVKAAQRSAALTRQLLAFSRRQTLQPQVLDPNDLVRNLEKMLRRLIGEDIELRLALAQDVGRVFVDPGQIEQVIMNLAVNARDAMPGGGRLSIGTASVELDEIYAATHPDAAPGEYLLLAVTDTGCGMEQEVLDRIFDPFFTTKEEGRGTGLGLATVYGIVKQSGGNIWVYSELGRGTTFKVYLPLTGALPEPAPGATEAVAPVRTGEHVLVVEDEEGLRNLMESLLSHLGYQVTLAANGGEALLLMEEKGLAPDLVVTDVVMPNMSGRQLVDRLRRARPNLRALYMSGYTDDTIVHHGVLDPGTPFLQKPFNIRDLGAKVREVLQNGPSPDEG